MNNTKIWRDAVSIDATLVEMTSSLRMILNTRGITKPFMVGIHTGGMWVAQHLHHALAIELPLGALDISFYRDDFTYIGLHPIVRTSKLPVIVDGCHIILVDDILHTGRTIRAALNALFDYGRPATVALAVLAVRTGRELPIAADVAGCHADILPDQYLKLTGPSPMQLMLAQATQDSDKKSSVQAPA